MSLARFVLRSAGPATLLMGALGLIGTAVNAGLIATVHRALSDPLPSGELGSWFLALALAKAVVGYASGRVADVYSLESVTELRREVIRRLLAVPYRRFEQLGAARALSTLTHDIAALHGALELTAEITVNAAVLIGGAIYLSRLSLQALLALALIAIMAGAIYALTSRHASGMLREARKQHDRLFELFESLIDGIRELKQNAARRKALLDGPVLETTEALLAQDLRANTQHALAQSLNGLLVLGAIGFVLFLLPVGQDAHSRAVVSGYVLTGLYLLGPLGNLLRLIPIYRRAAIALREIEAVGIQLSGAVVEPGAEPEARPSFNTIELRAVSFRYDERRGFSLGPLTFALAPGELVFVTGGNGSGKSTLAKLLVGLYEPDGGEVRWDDELVTRSTRDLYRQLFSVVLSEFHVFDRLYGLDPVDLDARARAWIERLGLTGIIDVEQGALSSREVSRGQSKRLALLAALLEDRPIYVLDEWAADQDVAFKEVFYRRLLPELKRRGKTLVVVSHDERFHDVADRVVRLRDGQVGE